MKDCITTNGFTFYVWQVTLPLRPQDSSVWFAPNKSKLGPRNCICLSGCHLSQMIKHRHICLRSQFVLCAIICSGSIYDYYSLGSFQKPLICYPIWKTYRQTPNQHFYWPFTRLSVSLHPPWVPWLHGCNDKKQSNIFLVKVSINIFRLL